MSEQGTTKDQVSEAIVIAGGFMKFLRAIFCRHKWDQRLWAESEHAMLCLKCGAIQYRKGPGGPLPEGISKGSP
jgi:hypothetical protein